VLDASFGEMRREKKISALLIFFCIVPVPEVGGVILDPPTPGTEKFPRKNCLTAPSGDFQMGKIVLILILFI